MEVHSDHSASIGAEFGLDQFQETMVIDEIVIDKFSHFDILDRPSANIMNQSITGNQ